MAGAGTQHSPDTGSANLSVRGDLKEMKSSFIKGGTIPGYGTSLFVGIGVPIPVLNKDIAKKTAIRNADIKTEIIDYGVPRLTKPFVGEASYEQLYSGRVKVDGKKIKTSPLSSLKVTYKLLGELQQLIEDKQFYLTAKVASLPAKGDSRPMKLKKGSLMVKQVMTKDVITAKQKAGIKKISALLIDNHIDQIPVVDDEHRLKGIITSRDITAALARNISKLSDIMTQEVITANENEALDIVSRRMDKESVDATPVVDKNTKVVGIVTRADIMRGVS